MKKVLLTGASVLAVVFSLSTGAKAQLIDIGLGDIVGDIGVELGVLDDLTVGGLLGGVLIDSDGFGVPVANALQNVALNISPSVATTAVVGTGIDAGVLTGLQAALGLTDDALAVAIETGDLASLLGGNVTQTGELATTAVGQIVNQANQTANQSVAIVDESLTVTLDPLSIEFANVVSEAAANTSNTASRASVESVTASLSGGGLDVAYDLSSLAIEGPVGNIANNVAINVSPSLATTAFVGVNAAVESISTTAAGQIATQVNSLGLDGASITGALTGNFPGGGVSAPLSGQ